MSRTQRKKDQDEVPPKPHIDFDPVMTTRFCFDSKNEDLKREARNLFSWKRALGEYRGRPSRRHRSIDHK